MKKFFLLVALTIIINCSLPFLANGTVIFPKKTRDLPSRTKASNKSTSLPSTTKDQSSKGRDEKKDESRNIDWITNCNGMSEFELQFEDVKLDNKIGFDSETLMNYQHYGQVTLGWIRRATACSVFIYLAKVIELNGKKPRVFFKASSEQSPASGPLGTSAPFLYGDGSAIMGGNLHSLIVNSFPAPGDYETEIYINFGDRYHYGQLIKIGEGDAESISLYSIILHEAMHSLGFASLIAANGQPLWAQASYSTFDKFLWSNSTNAGVQLLDLSVPSFVGPISSLSAGQIIFKDALNSVSVPLHSPPGFAPGNSLSHIDPIRDVQVSVMKPSAEVGPSIYNLSTNELGILCSLGYVLKNGTCSAQPIIGVDDEASTPEGDIICVDVLKNDIGSPKYVRFAKLQSGLGNLNYNQFRYPNNQWNNPYICFEPEPGFIGDIEILYEPAIGEQSGSTAKLTIHVKPPCENSDPCNLICNGSFETGTTDWDLTFPKITAAPPWRSLYPTPDMVNPHSLLPSLFGPPSDNRFAGMGSLDLNSNFESESIQGRFSNPLIAGKSYKLSFYAAASSSNSNVPFEKGFTISLDTFPKLISLLDEISLFGIFTPSPDQQSVAEVTYSKPFGVWTKLEAIITPNKSQKKILVIPKRYENLNYFQMVDHFSLVPLDSPVCDPNNPYPEQEKFEVVVQPNAMITYPGTNLKFTATVCNKSSKAVSPPVEVKALLSHQLSYANGLNNFPLHQISQNFSASGNAGDCHSFNFETKTKNTAQPGEYVQACIISTLYPQQGNQHCAKVLVGSIDFSVAKEAVTQTKTEINLGQVTFKITINNLTGLTWKNPSMLDQLPSQLDFLSADDPNISYDKLSAELKYVGEIAANTSKSFKMKYKLLTCVPVSNSVVLKDSQMILVNNSPVEVFDFLLENNLSSATLNPTCAPQVQTGKADLGAIGKNNKLIFNAYGNTVEYNGVKLPILIPFTHGQNGFPFPPYQTTSSLCETIQSFYLAFENYKANNINYGYNHFQSFCPIGLQYIDGTYQITSCEEKNTAMQKAKYSIMVSCQ
ncbi:MAG: hypothetical protein QE271_02190 [Bacteriovoracaceae bacterium]|nr:hypothetical protein [Bacteriovoracaceae bacterium]